MQIMFSGIKRRRIFRFFALFGDYGLAFDIKYDYDRSNYEKPDC